MTFSDESKWVVCANYNEDRFKGYLYLEEALSGNKRVSLQKINYGLTEAAYSAYLSIVVNKNRLLFRDTLD